MLDYIKNFFLNLQSRRKACWHFGGQVFWLGCVGWRYGLLSDNVVTNLSSSIMTSSLSLSPSLSLPLSLGVQWHNGPLLSHPAVRNLNELEDNPNILHTQG